MSAPKPHDRVHVAARFMRLPAVPTTEAYVRINTAAGAIDVKVSQDALLTTEGKPIEWNPPCNSLLLIGDEGFYLRCESTDHPKGKHLAHFSPSDLEWDDDDPNAVRIESTGAPIEAAYCRKDAEFAMSDEAAKTNEETES